MILCPCSSSSVTFQSLKRDIPLCNVFRATREEDNLLVSIAQARHPFMQRYFNTGLIPIFIPVSIAQARHPFMQLNGGTSCGIFTDKFQSLKRDIPLCNPSTIATSITALPGFNRSSATSLYATNKINDQINAEIKEVSIAQARHPFMQPTSPVSLYILAILVSIAQARHPFMQPHTLTRSTSQTMRFNRSSATSLYATTCLHAE